MFPVRLQLGSAGRQEISWCGGHCWADGIVRSPGYERAAIELFMNNDWAA